MQPVAERKTADERRESILDAALTEFARRGYSGASTDEIARGAGISQPYLFRLFGTKKELFMASAARCLGDTLAKFQEAAAGKQGEEALCAIGQAYNDLITEHPDYLRAQMQSYAACDDPEICAVVRKGFGELVDYVQRVSGTDPQRLMRFFAKGMLGNVLTAMRVSETGEPWAQTLLGACRDERA
jgi:AcrR family transcriptional regulator